MNSHHKMVSVLHAYTDEVAPTLRQGPLQLIVVQTQHLHLQQHNVMLQHRIATAGDCTAFTYANM